MRNWTIFLYILGIFIFRQVQYGNESLGKKWINSSVENLQEASAQGDSFAQAYLGLLFVHGDKKLQLDPEKAFKLASMSSESDHWLGHFVLGLLYRSGPIGPDLSKVREYYLRAFLDSDGKMIKLAAKKDPIASYALGEIFTSDELAPNILPDLKLAYRHYEVSAEEGFIPSAVQLALFKIHSLIPFEKNAANEIENGISILKESVSSEIPSAHHYLGRAFLEGIGLEKDLKMAFIHFQAAANKGYCESQLIMSDFYGQGVIDSPKLDLAIRYAKRALKTDYQRAKEKLNKYEALRDENPSGVAMQNQPPPLPSSQKVQEIPVPLPLVTESSADSHKSEMLPSSFSYAEKANPKTEVFSDQVQGSSQATEPFPLKRTADLDELKEKAKSHYWGRGVSNDYSTAFKLFMEASKVEDAESLRYLGLMYLTGKGVTKDPVVAINFFERAASKGDTMAAKYLDKIRSISNN